ncbi:helix-turn-helix transcriptional regulator [Pararhodobacter zhoushanensis]|uniref:Short-chain fatty acyl-CoA regulator family protein n=1 Tax=Pararhodobacter zhoushanensis TaxID=2479545 RepID=A0ABT3GZK7_9RHOB|nr:helix-turn-helix transcriptional regulator [Pararhodobacter zhoushanensis]MCW1932993.1 short-chain fatty acyl-CoA regulator family protein [Pararhodobacter zhoushanensis]
MPKSALSGTRIRALRTARRLGQADLARMAGVSPSYLNLIEHNRRRASPRIIEAIAGALQISPETLDERAGDAQVEALRAAAARAHPASVTGTAPEIDRAEELTGRFPGWAALITQLHTATETQDRTIERLSDRMAHDPNLSEALHEIVSAVTAVQSTAAILAESEDLEPEWRARFHRNIHQDSVRLANAAEALVAFLDTFGEETGLAAPQEELESWLEHQGFHVAAIEHPASPDWNALTSGQAELASAAARTLAVSWLDRARVDAQALPLAQLMPVLMAMLGGGGVFAPEVLARQFGVSLAQLFRRLATLPSAPGVPRFGLAVCDGSGTLTFRRPVDGFQLPRFGGACPLWPLYEALGQPDRPVRALVEFAGRPPARFVAHAIAGARDPLRFDPPHVWEASMLVTPALVAATSGDSAEPRGVGTSCRVCPRMDCPARREPSIVAG